jgi:glycosyltransferase involved in cell wall biosynthesis
VVQSHSVHCNGYPTYHELRPFKRDRLLYFDSRMHRDDVISMEALEARLRTLREGRRPRLLYSGRYNATKGVMHVVEVGLELIRMGLDFELHLYGKGDLQGEMEGRVRRNGAEDRIFVHDAVPFPELVGIAAKSDLFICCHVQDDPSCTYLESFGAGLPIVGYSNLMWKSLASDSGAGIVLRLGDRVACGRAIAEMVGDPEKLAACSVRARNFAAAHCFESEFDKRIARLRALIASGG